MPPRVFVLPCWFGHELTAKININPIIPQPYLPPLVVPSSYNFLGPMRCTPWGPTLSSTWGDRIGQLNISGGWVGGPMNCMFQLTKNSHAHLASRQSFRPMLTLLPPSHYISTESSDNPSFLPGISLYMLTVYCFHDHWEEPGKTTRDRFLGCSGIQRQI